MSLIPGYLHSEIQLTRVNITDQKDIKYLFTNLTRERMHSPSFSITNFYKKNPPNNLFSKHSLDFVHSVWIRSTHIINWSIWPWRVHYSSSPDGGGGFSQKYLMEVILKRGLVSQPSSSPWGHGLTTTRGLVFRFLQHTGSSWKVCKQQYLGSGSTLFPFSLSIQPARSLLGVLNASQMGSGNGLHTNNHKISTPDSSTLKHLSSRGSTFRWLLICDLVPSVRCRWSRWWGNTTIGSGC